MANLDAPFGLRPVSDFGAGSYAAPAGLYYAPATYATALFVGEAVTLTGEADARGVPEVNKTAAGSGNASCGSIVGFVSGADAGQGPPNVNDLSVKHGPASTLRYMLVADSPLQLFEIQANGAIVAADIGLNANLVDDHAGDAATGLAGTELNQATVAGTAAFQLKIRRLSNRLGNDLGANAVLIVAINNHQLAHAVAGV